MNSVFEAWANHWPSDYAVWQLDEMAPRGTIGRHGQEIAPAVEQLVAVGADSAYAAGQWLLTGAGRRVLCVVDRPEELLWIMQQPWLAELCSHDGFVLRYWSASSVVHGSLGDRALWFAMLRGRVAWQASPSHWQSLANLRAHLEARLDGCKTLSPHGGLAYENLWKLLPLLSHMHHEQALHGALQGESVIIAGGGPSLIEQLPLLRADRDQLLIWAGGAAVGPLVEAGIVPDLVGCLDPRETQQERLAQLMGHKVPLSCTLRSHASTVVGWDGPRFIGHKGFSGVLEEWLFSGLGVDMPLKDHDAPDVIGLLSSLALDAGVRSIHFIGRELSFQERPYASTEARFEHDSVRCPVGEHVVSTAPLWLLLADHTRQLIQNSPDVQWTTGSIGGLPIEGCHEMATEEWIEGYATPQGRLRLTQAVQAASTLEIRSEVVAEVRHTMLEQLRGLQIDGDVRLPLRSLLIEPATALAAELFELDREARKAWRAGIVQHLLELWS
ncbi:MAG: 6-hydroxymethylpterin diphosphokinase MptE-like protein [Chlamydiia bacterium]